MLSQLTDQIRQELNKSEPLEEKLKIQKRTKPLGIKYAKPSENIPESLLAGANHFREVIKYGDDVEQLADDLVKLVKKPELGDDGREAKRAAMNVEAAAMKLDKMVKLMNDHFAEGRQQFFDVVLAWDMYKKGAPQKKYASKDIADASEKELADAIVYSAKKMPPALRDFLNKVARANKLMRNSSKKMGLDFEELSDSEKKAIVDAGFDARDAASPMFGLIGSILKRTKEMVERIRENEKYESFSWNFDENLYEDQ